ncbi:MAG: uridine kinase [Actinobacteria bacterium HGW-Actinobacteria-8]|nr:MAG: uridine kinase [Actinobacteria bacterium HGW-Actinobacteria-8]
MMTDARAQVLGLLADAVLARSAAHKTHPVRVGIDGPDGSGKTILRAELADVLRGRGADVIEASVDDFHYPQSIRYAMGRDSWEGYWAGAFDYAHLINDLLGPLGPRGNLNFRTKSHDLKEDVPIEGGWLDASPDAILLVDGVLLQRRELIGSLEMAIYVDVPFEEAYKRLAVREDFPTDPEAPSNLRYTETQRHYLRTCGPVERADIVVDNTDPAAPSIVRPTAT